jgi:hypothetical protein
MRKPNTKSWAAGRTLGDHPHHTLMQSQMRGRCRRWFGKNSNILPVSFGSAYPLCSSLPRASLTSARSPKLSSSLPMLSSSESYRLEDPAKPGPSRRVVASLLCSRNHRLPSSELVSSEGAGALSGPVNGLIGGVSSPDDCRLGKAPCREVGCAGGVARDLSERRLVIDVPPTDSARPPVGELDRLRSSIESTNAP